MWSWLYVNLRRPLWLLLSVNFHDAERPTWVVPANMLVDPAWVVAAVLAVGTLQPVRAVLHHVTTQQFQVGVGVETVRTSMQLQCHAQRGGHSDRGRFSVKVCRMFRNYRWRIFSFTRAADGTVMRRRKARFPCQRIVFTDVLQWDGTLLQHPFDALVLLWITHVRHGNIETNVLRPEVFAHAPPARLRVWTVHTPTHAHSHRFN